MPSPKVFQKGDCGVTVKKGKDSSKLLARKAVILMKDAFSRTAKGRQTSIIIWGFQSMERPGGNRPACRNVGRCHMRHFDDHGADGN
jgi:hypothetical protein